MAISPKPQARSTPILNTTAGHRKDFVGGPLQQ